MHHPLIGYIDGKRDWELSVSRNRMQPFLHSIGKRFIKLIKSLAQSRASNEKKLFGLGQFVLLLSLTPYLFDLSLYQLSDVTETPAQ